MSIIESLPPRPLSGDEVQTIRETDGFHVAFPVMAFSGPEGKEIVEDMVLSTDSRSILVSLPSGGDSWHVVDRWEHDPDEDPVDVGMCMLSHASGHLVDELEDIGEDR